MSSKKLLTIFGATGNQGGSVISTILGSSSLSSKYALRAITRDPFKPNAQSLSSKGVEIAKADLNDPASVASAIKGSYGVFAVTNYWETLDKEVEYCQGKNVIDACKNEGVIHLVWSSLPHVSKLTSGVLTKVEHFDSKADVAEYAKKVKGDMLVSYFMPGYFMSNLMRTIKKQEDGVVAVSLPWDPEKTWVPMLDVRSDTGKFVAGLFEAGEKANDVFVQGVSEWTHPQNIVDTLSKIVGREIKFNQSEMTVEIADKMPKIPAELMENMMLIRDYSYFGKGMEEKQAESDKLFLDGKNKVTWEEFAKGCEWKF